MATTTEQALLARYDELEALIQRALAAIARGDRAQAVLLGYGVVGKMTELNRRIEEVTPDRPDLITALERPRHRKAP